MNKYEYLPQNSDRLGNSNSEARLYAPTISETHGFKMMQGTTLTTERKNPSYRAWIKSRIRRHMAYPKSITIAKAEDDSLEGEELSSEEADSLIKKKGNEFVKNYLISHDPNLATISDIELTAKNSTLGPGHYNIPLNFKGGKAFTIPVRSDVIQLPNNLVSADPSDPVFAGHAASSSIKKHGSPFSRREKAINRTRGYDEEMENIEEFLENQVENSEILDKEFVERYVEKKLEISKMRPANTRSKDNQSATNLSRVPRFGQSSF